MNPVPNNPNVQLSFTVNAITAGRVLAMLTSDLTTEKTEVRSNTMPFPISGASSGTAGKRKRRTKAEMEALRAQSEKEDETTEDEETEESEDEEETETGEPEEEDDFEGDEEEVDESDEEEETEEAKPAVKAKSKVKAPVLTLENDIRPAFRDYSKRTTREKAIKVLARFGVKTVTELPPSKYAEVLKILRN